MIFLFLCHLVRGIQIRNAGVRFVSLSICSLAVFQYLFILFCLNCFKLKLTIFFIRQLLRFLKWFALLMFHNRLAMHRETGWP